MPIRRYPKSPRVTTDFAARIAFGLNELPMILPVSIPFLRLELARGNLKTIKLGRRRIILREQLNEWLESGAAAALKCGESDSKES